MTEDSVTGLFCMTSSSEKISYLPPLSNKKPTSCTVSKAKVKQGLKARQ